jgi:predicted nucleic acid-binding protein
MKKIVIDSSVVIKWLNSNREDDLEKADKLLSDVRSGKVELLAPEVMKYEVGKVFYYSKRLTQLESKIVLDAFFHLPIKCIVLDQELSKEAHAIASAYDLSYDESIYLALAEQKGAIYITDIPNPKLMSSGVKTVLLKDY